MPLNKIFFTAVISCALFSSCLVIHSGNVSSGPLLNVKDKYVDVAKGYAGSFFLFGIGDIHRDNLILDAKKMLYQNRPLNQNEYYSNFSVDISKKFILGFISVVNVNVGSDVMRNGDTLETGVFSRSFKNTIGIIGEKSFFVSEKDTFKIGEEVYYASHKQEWKTYNRFRIISILNGNVNLKRIYSTEENEIVFIDKHNFYSTVKNLKEFSIGDKVKTRSGLFNEVLENGTIIGTCNDHVLARSKSGISPFPVVKLELVK